MHTTLFFRGFLSAMGHKRVEGGVPTLILPLADGKLLADADMNDIGHTARLSCSRMASISSAGPSVSSATT
ncbi:hypothetical protein [Streptomyces sp. SudanB66_2053]